MGKFMKDNYASTYAAVSVKQALDKLIDVLQVSEELAAGSQDPRKPHTKPPKTSLETPTKIPPSAETSASIAKDSTPNAEKTITPPPVTDQNPSDKRKMVTNPSGYRPPRCGDPSRYISLDAYNQVWTRGLREYPKGGSLVQSGMPKLEAGWSSVPCKPGLLAAFADPVADTFTF